MSQYVCTHSALVRHFPWFRWVMGFTWKHTHRSFHCFFLLLSRNPKKGIGFLKQLIHKSCTAFTNCLGIKLFLPHPPGWGDELLLSSLTKHRFLPTKSKWLLLSVEWEITSKKSISPNIRYVTLFDSCIGIEKKTELFSLLFPFL